MHYANAQSSFLSRLGTLLSNGQVNQALNSRSRHTDGQTNGQPGRQTDKQTGRQKDNQTKNKQTNKQRNRQTNRQKTNRFTNKQTNKQLDKQTNKQTDRQADRWTQNGIFHFTAPAFFYFGIFLLPTISFWFLKTFQPKQNLTMFINCRNKFLFPCNIHFFLR